MNSERLGQILDRFARVRIVVCGDFFLDNYLVLDRALSVPSLETGLEAFQVIETRKYPGVAGTTTNNLRTLGVNVLAVGVIGDDGNGYELRRKLEQSGVDTQGLVEVAGLETPTYMKPMMREVDGQEHELNRMDTMLRRPIEAEVENRLMAQIECLLDEADGMLVIDQSWMRDYATVTDRVRDALPRLAGAYPGKLILADSRLFTGLFRDVTLKCNLSEAQRATAITPQVWESNVECAARCAAVLQQQTRRTVVITLGGDGMYLLEASGHMGTHLPAVPVSGRLDIVGAGDCVNAALGAALCAGASLEEAGWVANLAASIVIQQIGMTGTATQAQLLARFKEYYGSSAFNGI